MQVRGLVYGCRRRLREARFGYAKRSQIWVTKSSGATVSVRIDPTIKKLLEKLAKSTERSRSPAFSGRPVIDAQNLNDISHANSRR